MRKSNILYTCVRNQKQAHEEAIHHWTLLFMYVLKVPLQVILALKHTRAQVTLEGLDVTNTMDSR